MDKETIEDIMQYFAEMVEDFAQRYGMALRKIAHYRCNTRYADHELFEECEAALDDYCEDNELNRDDFDLDEILM